MKYSIVIPTYNHCDDLLKPCIESIIKYTNLDNVEVIVVANGCEDNTRQYVESLGSPFKLIWEPLQLGFPKAVNLGIKACQGDHVILLNNDVELTDQPINHWITLLEQPFKNPLVGATGPAVGWHYELNALGVLFFCAMIKKEVFEKVGYLDEIYTPGGVEDHDFCHRVILAGYQLASAGEEVDTITKTFPLLHKSNKTFQDLPAGYNRVLKRNNDIFKRKFGSSKKYSIVIPTYDSCDTLLKPCIDSILKYTKIDDIELIVVSNGSLDETESYLKYLKHYFAIRGLSDNFKYACYDQPLGYSKATNIGIKMATCDRIVLLNNDTILLEQHQNRWLEQLNECFVRDPKCGIGCLIKTHSHPAGKDFAVFFCVMIDRKVFDAIGLLNEEYGVGGGEDTEFSIEAEKAGFTVVEAVQKDYSADKMLFVGDFPMYHRGEGTVHNNNLVEGWEDVYLDNSLKLAKKYNKEWYRWRISNYLERAVFLKGDPVMPQFPRENCRYTWAAKNLYGKKVLEIGCSSGYGTQYLPRDVDYTGVDYDRRIIKCAQEQEWGDNFKFVYADINKFDLEQYDTIVAFEVIEHLPNGLEVVERLKNHCKRLLITVPRKEPPGYWGPHHLIHNLEESMFPGFQFKYIDEPGNLLDEPNESIINLMVCRWDRDGE